MDTTQRIDEAELTALVDEAYLPEGRDIFWRAYRAARPEEQVHMALHLKLGVEGACS